MVRKYVMLWIIFAALLLVSSCASVRTISNEELAVNQLRCSIVDVVNVLRNHRCTGWIADIDGRYVIFTAKHLFCDRPDKVDGSTVWESGFIEVRDMDGRTYVTDIISFDSNWDLDTYQSSDWVILACPEEFQDLPALKLSSTSPYFGEIVYWAGFGDTASSAIAERVIIGDEFGDSGMRRVSGAYGPGASGSPIYDPDLGVVGMLVRSYSETCSGIVIDIPIVYDYLMDEYMNDIIIF